MLHIHYYGSFRDCDGPLEVWNDYVPDPQVPAMQGVDPEDAMDIARKYVLPALFAVPDFDGVEVRITIATDGGRYILTSSRPTEEGYSNDYYEVCSCDDFEEGSRQRDHFAEAAGY